LDNGYFSIVKLEYTMNYDNHVNHDILHIFLSKMSNTEKMNQ